MSVHLVKENREIANRAQGVRVILSKRLLPTLVRPEVKTLCLLRLPPPPQEDREIIDGAQCVRVDLSEGFLTALQSPAVKPPSLVELAVLVHLHSASHDRAPFHFCLSETGAGILLPAEGPGDEVNVIHWGAVLIRSALSNRSLGIGL